MVADILMKPDINKRRKVELLEEEEEEKSTADYDYISGLPDHILHEILSYLHYDDIVRTSCLSKRWRYLWASRPRLSFQIDDMNSLSERNTYQGVADQQVDNPDSRKRRARRLVNSVNQVLSIREGPIQYFSLSFDPVKDESTHPEFIDDSYTWIDMLQSRRVLYMKLDFSEYYGSLYGAHDSPKYLLPNKLFKFEFLTVLSLSYCRLQLPIPDGGECFALKSLRLLDLHYVSVTNKEMMEGILPNVPRLMGLTIKKCHELTELHIPYELLNLKRMLVSSCFRIDKVEAHAPNLDVFFYIGRLIQLSVNKSAPVTNVALRFNSHASDDHIPDGWFLGRPRHDLASIWHMLPLIFPAVVDLRLTVVAPKLASKELSIGVKEHSSTYANLKTLYWPMSTAHRVDFSYLLHILQSCPSLEEIIIPLTELSTGCYLKAKYRDIFHERNQEIWVPPDSEYSVQLGPVKNIIIDGFTAEKNQMELIKFLLHKCSLTLELLTIEPSRDITSWFKATHSVEPHEIHNCYSTAKMELLSTAAKVVSGPFSMKPKVVCLPLDLNLKGH